MKIVKITVYVNCGSIIYSVTAVLKQIVTTLYGTKIWVWAECSVWGAACGGECAVALAGSMPFSRGCFRWPWLLQGRETKRGTGTGWDRRGSAERSGGLLWPRRVRYSFQANICSAYTPVCHLFISTFQPLNH